MGKHVFQTACTHPFPGQKGGSEGCSRIPVSREKGMQLGSSLIHLNNQFLLKDNNYCNLQLGYIIISLTFFFMKMLLLDTSLLV